MDKNAFMKLVNDNDGFEFVIGYRDDLDYYIGGVGNKYWFQWIKGKDSEYYIGTYENGVWTDKHYIAKNKKIIESNTVEPETTINKIVERAYYYQDRIGNKKPTEIDKEYDTFLHYVFGFGEKSWEVSKKYGVTVSFSNINKVEEGYQLRDYYIGSEVDKPKEN